MGKQPVIVAVANLPHLRTLLTNGAEPIVLDRWPETGEARILVVANPAFLVEP